MVRWTNGAVWREGVDASPYLTISPNTSTYIFQDPLSIYKCSVSSFLGLGRKKKKVVRGLVLVLEVRQNPRDPPRLQKTEDAISIYCLPKNIYKDIFHFLRQRKTFWKTETTVDERKGKRKLVLIPPVT